MTVPSREEVGAVVREERERVLAALINHEPGLVLSAADYWLDHAKRGPPLRPLGKPCHDCAVVDGFYQELSDELACQPADVRNAVCGNWYCHNHPNRACAGNINNVRAFLKDQANVD